MTGVGLCLCVGLALGAATGCDARIKILDPPGDAGQTWTTEPARWSDGVVEAISVGIHLGATAAPSDNYAVVKQRLMELGVRHVMDPSSQPDLTRVRELGALGIHAQLAIDSLGDYFHAAEAASDVIDAFQVDPLVTASTTLDQTWLQGRRNFCSELFTAAKLALPSPIVVVGPDLDFPDNFPVVDFGPCVDFGTTHRQRTVGPPSAQSLEGQTLDQQLEAQRPRATQRRMLLGQDGYGTQTGDAAAVSEIVQAKYLGRLVFEAFNRDFVRVFLGGITDRPGDQSSADRLRLAAGTTANAAPVIYDGLNHFDGTTKPSFIAVRNLIGLLADKGSGFSTGSLLYRIEEAPPSLHHTLLQKRDGTFLLALWLEAVSTDTKVTAPITVRFPNPAVQVTTFAPQDSPGPVDRLQNVSTLAINVADQVTLVQIATFLPESNNFCDRALWKASASARGDGAGPIAGIDGDLATRWDTMRLQDGTDWYQVDFGGPVKLSGITLDNIQTFPGDYPGAYEVYGSSDGIVFDVSPFASGPGTTRATVISFPQHTLRAVKINQVGTANSTHWFGIGEFEPTCQL